MTGLFVWRILSGNIFEENIFCPGAKEIDKI